MFTCAPLLPAAEERRWQITVTCTESLASGASRCRCRRQHSGTSGDFAGKDNDTENQLERHSQSQQCYITVMGSVLLELFYNFYNGQQTLGTWHIDQERQGPAGHLVLSRTSMETLGPGHLALSKMSMKTLVACPPICLTPCAMTSQVPRQEAFFILGSTVIAQ